jgi:two-component system, LytTR family, sensor histidine kinase AgrC
MKGKYNLLIVFNKGFIFLRKHMIVKEYYKIILIFVLQMMFLTVFVTHNFMKIHVYTPSKTQTLIEMILGILIFFLCFISIFIVKKLYKTAQEQHINKINELKYSHIEEQSRIYQQNKHDILNHLIVLSLLAKEESLEELKDYLSEYQAEISNVLISVNTGLREMDILLYAKINTAQTKNMQINFKCYANLECRHRYIINLISIFSNLLDNAIEASNISEEKKLSVFIKEDPLDYICIVQNSFSVDNRVNPIEIIHKGISTKGSERGKGISIIKDLVKKFGGTISYNVVNGLFEVKVDLPKHKLQI